MKMRPLPTTVSPTCRVYKRGSEVTAIHHLGLGTFRGLNVRSGQSTNKDALHELDQRDAELRYLMANRDAI